VLYLTQTLALALPVPRPFLVPRRHGFADYIFGGDR
jgi:hypothetical protein